MTDSHYDEHLQQEQTNATAAAYRADAAFALAAMAVHITSLR